MVDPTYVPIAMVAPDYKMIAVRGGRVYTPDAVNHFQAWPWDVETLKADHGCLIFVSTAVAEPPPMATPVSYVPPEDLEVALLGQDAFTPPTEEQQQA